MGGCAFHLCESGGDPLPFDLDALFLYSPNKRVISRFSKYQKGEKA